MFPMVVAPRYMPGQPVGKEGGGWSPDTTQVGDASRISPQVTPKGTRAGHDISIEVTLDAGVPINFLRSLTHDLDIERPTPRTAKLHLKDQAVIPNKDLVLQYDVSGKTVADAVLAHRDARGGFFTMILQPPAKAPAADIRQELALLPTPRIDVASRSRRPETMKLALRSEPGPFNLITFSGDTGISPKPFPPRKESLSHALWSRAPRPSVTLPEDGGHPAALDPVDADPVWSF
jgi:Ca-activated chloride channel family protein